MLVGSFSTAPLIPSLLTFAGEGSIFKNQWDSDHSVTTVSSRVSDNKSGPIYSPTTQQTGLLWVIMTIMPTLEAPIQVGSCSTFDLVRGLGTYSS